MPEPIQPVEFFTPEEILRGVRAAIALIPPPATPWEAIPPEATVCSLHRCYWEWSGHEPGPECRCLAKSDVAPTSSWYIDPRGKTAWLSHAMADDEGPIWADEIEIWRGAPSWDSHPELLHGLLALQLPRGKGIHNTHQEFVLGRWTYSIPDFYLGQTNAGENHRRYMILRGGLLSWTLVLRLPVGAPPFVWRAIASGFKAEKE